MSGKENCTCDGSDLQLIKHIHKQQNFKLYFDNWFSTLPLMLKMKDLGILLMATVYARIALQSGRRQILEKKGRGSSSYMVDVNSTLIVMKWFDNKAVHRVSNHGTITACSQVKC